MRLQPRQLPVTTILASIHFGICVGLLLLIAGYGKMSHFSPTAVEGWEAVANGLLGFLCQPTYGILDAFGLGSVLPFWLFLILFVLNSLLWGFAFLPLALFLKRRLFQEPAETFSAAKKSTAKDRATPVAPR